MRVHCFIIILVILCTALINHSYSQDEEPVVFYEKYLSNGIKATIYKSVSIRIITDDDVDKNLPENIHPILDEYIDYNYEMKLSNSDHIVWSYIYSYPKADPGGLSKANEIVIFDVISKDDYVYVLYFDREIFCDVLKKQSGKWIKLTSIDITMGLASRGTIIIAGNLFVTDSGLYANLVHAGARRELWLLSTTDYDDLKGGPIILWTNKGSRKGKEYEQRNSYHRKKARLEYEIEKKAEEEANAKTQTNTKNNIEDKNIETNCNSDKGKKDEHKEFGEPAYQKFVENGSVIRMYKSKIKTIAPITILENNKPLRVINQETYIYKYIYYTESDNFKTFLWSFGDYIQAFMGPQITYEVYDLLVSDNKAFFMYKYNNQVYLSSLLKIADKWSKPIIREITELDLRSVTSSKLFKTDSGLYAILYYSDNLQELWLVSTESPIILWTNKGNKKRHESEFRKEDKIKKAREARNNKLVDEAAINKIDETGSQNKTNNNMGLTDINTSANTKNSGNNDKSDSNAVNNVNRANIKNNAGSVLDNTNIRDSSKIKKGQSNNTDNIDNTVKSDTSVYLWILAGILCLVVVVFIIRRK